MRGRVWNYFGSVQFAKQGKRISVTVGQFAWNMEHSPCSWNIKYPFNFRNFILLFNNCRLLWIIRMLYQSSTNVYFFFGTIFFYVHKIRFRLQFLEIKLRFCSLSPGIHICTHLCCIQNLSRNFLCPLFFTKQSTSSLGSFWSQWDSCKPRQSP